MTTTAEHIYRGYSFTADRETGLVQILTRQGLEWMPALEALALIDASWSKFDGIRSEVIAGKSKSIVSEALAVAVNAWEYEGEYEKAKEALALINGRK